MNKVFSSALTGVISVAMLSAISIAPAHATRDREDVVTPISISSAGTPAVGSVLTLIKQTYSFTEGRSTATWLRCISSVSLTNKASDISTLVPGACAVIPSANSTTYTVTEADLGKHITVISSIAEQASGQPTNDGVSVAQSLLIGASTPTTGGTTTGGTTTGGTTTGLPAQSLVKAIPTKAKAGKAITIAAVTNAKVATKVKVKGKGCKVAAVKDKKNKKKIASYKVTMGKKGGTCTVTVTAPATTAVAALNSVSKIKAS